MDKLGKLASLSISVIILIILVIGLSFQAQNAMRASERANEAQKNLEVAKENLAQSYADLPWTSERIIQDINNRVISGQYGRALGDRLIQRVQQIRNNP